VTEQARAKRKRDKVEITGYVEKTLKERVRVHGQREGLSESEIVRTAVREYFFRRGDRLPAPPSPQEAFAAVPSLDAVRAAAMQVFAVLPVAANAVRRRRRRARRRPCDCRCRRRS
jgi:hypothetical protein